jgi:uncharacterized protein (DUF1697 family)
MRSSFIALLRGINVSGHNRIPMKELVPLVEELGFEDVRHYIQSGNLVFAAGSDAATIEGQIEAAIEQHFQLRIPVIVRSDLQWPAYVSGNPFPEAAATRGNGLMLALSKQPLKAGVVEGLRERALCGERIEQVGDALWVDYAEGVAKSKLLPALFDRLAGSSVTARNWNTVLKLAQMSRAAL